MDRVERAHLHRGEAGRALKRAAFDGYVMAGLYIDTSALGRVLLAEPDAVAIRATLR